MTWAQRAKAGVDAKHFQEVLKAKSLLNVGGLYFEDDRDLGILQAADVVAWGVPRRTTGKPFGYAFEPINDILNKQEGHREADWEAGWLKEVSESVMKRYWEAKVSANSL